MDYKEEYEKAFERAKKGLPIDEVFPELKESKDEKRMKAIAVLKQQRYYWSYDGPSDKTPPATTRKELVEAIDVALPYLEKQKEPKDVIASTMAPGCWQGEEKSSEESEDEKIRKELIGMINECTNWPHKKEYVKYLEKQKEYVSDNFDDVWTTEDCAEIIEAGEKLSPRFKELFKEVCHAWYDKGIELEKHKEQKLKPVFKVGDKIKPKSEPKYPYREIVDIRDEVYYFDESEIVPFDMQDKWEKEQKPAEWSNDERIRNGMLEAFKRSDLEVWSDANLPIKDIIAYLEKQKERERIVPEREATDFEIEIHEIIAQAMSDKRLADKDVLEQFEREAAWALMWKAEKQKEQKPAVLSDDFELALEQFLMNADSSSNTFAEDVKKYANRLREIARKEQKLVDLSEMMVHKEPYIVPVPTPIVADEQKPVERVEINKSLSDAVITELSKYNGENYWESPWAIDSTGLQYPLYFANLGATWQKEQNPTEWSEEDENMINSLIRDYEYAVESALGVWKNEFKNKVNWLKSHPERFNLHPKQEWSEEDERMLSRCLKSIECSKQFSDSDTFKIAKDKEISWLKDLCAKLPYRVLIERKYIDCPTGLHEDDLVSWKLDEISNKPYLRPMSSMTGKEETEWHELTFGQRWITFDNVGRCVDWLNSHHFDYRGLIKKGLALEAPEGMYDN